MSYFRVRLLAEMSHCLTVKSTMRHLMLKILSSMISRDSKISSKDSSAFSSEMGASGVVPMPKRSSLDMSYATKGTFKGSSFLFINAKSYAGFSSSFSSSKDM